MRAMGGVGTLYAIVHRNSEAASQVRWHLYKSNDDPDEERDEVKSHLALTVWNKPNNFYTRQSFVETIQQHLDLTGEAYWIVSRAGGNVGPPVELWPVRPDRMHPVPNKDNFLQGWQYLSPIESVPLETSQVIQLKIPCPWDPYRGLGPVQSVLIDLESAKYAAEWNRNFFLNSAQPGGIVEIGRAHVKNPGLLQLSHIGGCHLGQGREAHIALVMAIGRPFLRQVGGQRRRAKRATRDSDRKQRGGPIHRRFPRLVFCWWPSLSVRPPGAQARPGGF